MLSDTLRETTDKLVKKFGSTIVLNKVTQGTYDPDTGLTNDTKATTIVKGVVSAYLTSELVPDVININDLNVMVYASSLDIDKEWTVTYQSQEWKILNIETKTIQDKIIYFKLQIRAK